MPIKEMYRRGTSTVALWHLTESEQELQTMLESLEEIPGSLTNPEKRLEWAAARLLTKALMHDLGYFYKGIEKDPFGKPSPAGYEYHLSLSHSYPYVAAILDTSFSVGIELEQPKPKLLRVAPRVLSPSELQDAGDDLSKHCIYWCAKEVLIKIHGKKDLVLAENLEIESFSRDSKGEIIGRIIVPDNQRLIPLHYQVTSQYVLVYNRTPDR